jgi:3-oxoacyl-[acyl-carrier protein] reductase
VTDRYQKFVHTPVGRLVSKNLGLPTPVKLERYEPGQPVISGPVLIGTAPNGRSFGEAARVLGDIGAPIYTYRAPDTAALADAKVQGQLWNPAAEKEKKENGEQTTFKALVFDASGISSSQELRELYAFFHPVIRRVQPCGRVVVLGVPPEACTSVAQATAQRALEGFTRSVGKEVKRGSTAQLIYVAPKAEDQIESTLRFFLSPRSAYVSGQVVRITPANVHPEIDWSRPLAGKVAAVTGASRGIGEAIATVLARDGATVVGIDIPDMSDELNAVMKRLGGSALTVDISVSYAPDKIADYLLKEHQGVDVFVHNAGITRDRTLGSMTESQWNSVIEINLSSIERINHELTEQKALKNNGRIICVSSVSGIAGNMGQTNYATSKAGVIGLIQSTAAALRTHHVTVGLPLMGEKDVPVPGLPGVPALLQERHITINAVAPGFIETQMTAKVPFAIREAGRRMNSMSQGGLPIDVAETIAWFASPGSAGTNGNVVRVCGQMLLGA